MKQQLLNLLCIMLAIPAFAQKPDSTLAMVHYKFSHVRDTNARDKPYTENMVLLVGQNASVYKSYDRKMQMEAMKKDAMAQMQSGGPIKITSRGTSTNSEYYQFPNEGKLIRKESIMTTYLIDEPFPVIQWKISTDTMTIRNLSCQKATGYFKGRDYTAWFCAELPYRSGPWKLNGLPGLIVEAYDTKKEVEFRFDGIEQVTKATKPAAEAASPSMGGARVFINGMGGSNDDPSIIALPDNGVKTTPKEFDNLREAMRKDPQAFMQSAMAGSGMNIKPSGGSGGPVSMNVVKRSDGPAIVINNPLELPEKK